MFRLFEHYTQPEDYIHGSDSMSTEAIFGSSKTEKINQFLMLIKDPEVQPFFRNYIENIIATSELKILKRLKAIETTLELNDYPIEDNELRVQFQDKSRTFLDQIKEIMKTNNKQSMIEPIHESVHIGMSKTTEQYYYLRM